MTVSPNAGLRNFYASCAVPKPSRKSDRKAQLRDDAQKRRDHLKANPHCESCGKRAIGAHHVLFKGMGGTRAEVSDRQLMSLCDVCHGTEHGLKVIA